MSFDVWVGCFQNGELATFPRSIVERAFAAIADRSDPTSWKLADCRGRLSIDDQAEINGFSVNRPPAHDEFWDAIIEVLQQTPSVLYWPGNGCVIADSATAKHLPSKLIAAVGMPTVTNVPSEILDLIQKA